MNNIQAESSSSVNDTCSLSSMNLKHTIRYVVISDIDSQSSLGPQSDSEDEDEQEVEFKLENPASLYPQQIQRPLIIKISGKQKEKDAPFSPAFDNQFSGEHFNPLKRRDLLYSDGLFKDFKIVFNKSQGNLHKPE